MTVTIVLLILIVVFIVLSGFFSGSETGAYCLNPVRLRLRSDQGDVAAIRLQRLMSDPHGILSTTLIGTNLSNYLATACLALLLSHTLFAFSAREVEFLTTLILTPTIFVFGEVVPKNWFRLQANPLMLRCHMVLLVFHRLFRWSGAVPALTWLSQRLLKSWHSAADMRQALHPRREIAALLREGVAEGVLSDQQSRLVDGVLKLSAVSIGQVMVPFAKVRNVPQDARRQDILRIMRQHANSRFPVVGANRRRVLGIIDIYDYMADANADDIAPHIAPAMSINPGASVFATLYRMREARQTFGIVVDRWNNCIGIVTVKDLVEEIVGELHAW